MKKRYNENINRFILFISKINFQKIINKTVLYFITIFIFIGMMTFTGGCFAMLEEKDTISNLSFSHDGKSVVFDRCREGDCGIQVYNLETGELAAYQSPHNEQWTMGKYSYDGKKITFSVIPIKPNDDLDLGNMQIAVMDADGKNYKKVTTGSGAKLYPTFSHNGKKILYACAAYIREEGKTPAAKYDAWEVNLETGRQTQLTFCEYFYMGNLTYFPDDERFIYYGDRPVKFNDISWYKDEKAFGKLVKDLSAQGKEIHGVVVMKGKELIKNPYVFPEKTFPEKPLLSKDGTKLIYEKSLSAGKFFLYSPDGTHRLVSNSGSVSSIAISPDGQYFGSNFNDSVFVKRISDGTYVRAFFVRRSDKWEESVQKMPYIRLLPRTPSRIINSE